MLDVCRVVAIGSFRYPRVTLRKVTPDAMTSVAAIQLSVVCDIRGNLDIEFS